jgi:hypothetical protein
MDMSEMPGMAMPAADQPQAEAMTMTGQLGPYPMSRDATGTSWQPDSAPAPDLEGRLGSWSLMGSGYGTLVYDDQGGPRGAWETFVETMTMGMAQHAWAGGVLTLRGMGSLDPLMGPRGYPLLLQTGETANGRTVLVDRQHPHNLVMELAAAYAHPLVEGVWAFVYGGWPAEPALGPVTYMSRFSGNEDPETPIGHHGLDSTHISDGVATGGLVIGDIKLEASRFTGREPNQNRWTIGHPTFDSWSARLTWNPSRDLSLQVSRGWLKSPEQLEPSVNQIRTTASATYNRPLEVLSAAGDWQTTLAFGEDDDRPGSTTQAYLLESTASLARHSVFGRVESVSKDDLFGDEPQSPLYDRLFTVAKLSFGYVYTLPLAQRLGLDLGALLSAYGLPRTLEGAYGSNPRSLMIFIRLKTGS